MARYTCPSSYRSSILITMVHDVCESAPSPNLLFLTKILPKKVSIHARTGLKYLCAVLLWEYVLEHFLLLQDIPCSKIVNFHEKISSQMASTFMSNCLFMGFSNKMNRTNCLILLCACVCRVIRSLLECAHVHHPTKVRNYELQIWGLLASYKDMHTHVLYKPAQYSVSEILC